MKPIKLFKSAAVVCFLAVFNAVPAYAQVGEVITDYCEKVLNNSDRTLIRLEEATGDLLDCADEYDDCGSGLLGSDPVECISDYRRCIRRGNSEQDRACNKFFSDLKSDTRSAERDADRADVEDEFQLWFSENWDDPDSCLAPARTVSTLCAGLSPEE